MGWCLAAGVCRRVEAHMHRTRVRHRGYVTLDIRIGIKEGQLQRSTLRVPAEKAGRGSLSNRSRLSSCRSAPAPIIY
jgi:hypothetical protein